MSVTISGLDAAAKKLQQVDFLLRGNALADGLNRTALALERQLKVSMSRDLDKPTPFTLNGLRRFRAYPNRLTAGVFVQNIQAKYLRYTIFGGTLDQVMTPIAVTRDAAGNIPGKRKGWAGIAKRAGGKRGKTSSQGLPGDMFVAEIRGIYGLWQRFDRTRTGRGSLSDRPPRLLVMLDRKTRRAKRWDFYGIGQRVVTQRLPRDMTDAINAALRK